MKAKATTGDPTDSVQKELVGSVDDLFQSTSKVRLKHELEWYANQLFVDGDHWVKFEQLAGKTGRITSDPVDGADKKKVRRSVNLIRSQLRGLKNMVQKIPLTVETVPNPKDNSPEEKQRSEDEAKQKNAVWRGIEYDLKLRHKIPGMVEDGFIKYAGYMFILPTADGFIEAIHYDSFDVYVDPTASAFEDARFLFLTPRQSLSDVKANKAYDNTGELKGEAKLAASQFKASYEQSKLGGSKAQLDGDLATTIPHILMMKMAVTLQDAQPTIDPATGQPGQAQQQLVPTQNGEHRIWIITVAEGQLLKVEETNFTRFPGAPYYPEQIGNRVYNRAWIHHLKDLNKSVDTMYSSAEEYFLKNRSKILVPTDSKLKEVTNVQAEVLEYEARNADGIKEFTPAGLPQSLFSLMDVGKAFIGQIGGLNEASVGLVPSGVKSGRGIEALKASDAETNVAEPIANLGLTYETIAEIAFEVIAEYTTTPRTITFPDDNGGASRVTFVGAVGMQQQDGSTVPAPNGTVVISPSRVKVATIPAISYTEEGKKETLKELYEMHAIDLKTLLEGYRFQGIDDIIENVITEKQQQSMMPPPPERVPGDKLITALAKLQASGEALSLEVVNAAFAQANLPPLNIAPPPNPLSPVPPSVPAPIDAPPQGATIHA